MDLVWSWLTPMTAATLTMLTLLTAATRSPAEITGTARGSSTVNSRRSGATPIAVAAAVTGAGTAARASATVRVSRARV